MSRTLSAGDEKHSCCSIQKGEENVRVQFHYFPVLKRNMDKMVLPD